MALAVSLRGAEEGAGTTRFADGVVGHLLTSGRPRSAGSLRRLLRHLVGLSVKARSDDGDAHFITQVVVDDGAEDEVDVAVGLLLHHGRGLVHFLQAQIGTAGDGQQHALGAFHCRLEQRRVNGLLGRGHDAVITARGTDTHERGAGIRHDRAHVGEVDVDHARDEDEVRDTLHAVVENLIGGTERLHHRQVLIAQLEQAVVRDDDEGVADLAQGLDALHSLAGAARALELERAGYHANGQRALLLGDGRNHRRRAGAGSAALTGGDENHVRARQGILDLGLVILRGSTPDLRVRTGTQAAGGLATDVELHVGVGEDEGL